MSAHSPRYAYRIKASFSYTKTLASAQSEPPHGDRQEQVDSDGEFLVVAQSEELAKAALLEALPCGAEIYEVSGQRVDLLVMVEKF